MHFDAVLASLHSHLAAVDVLASFHYSHLAVPGSSRSHLTVLASPHAHLVVPAIPHSHFAVPLLLTHTWMN